jgi:hypothetical protein
MAPQKIAYFDRANQGKAGHGHASCAVGPVRFEIF